MPAEYAWLIPLLPLLASAWIALGYVLGRNRGEAGEKETAWVALGAATLSFLLAVILGIQAMLQGAPGQVVATSWLASLHVSVGTPSTRTVQAPQPPDSHKSLVPVSPSLSRRRSMTVSGGASTDMS